MPGENIVTVRYRPLKPPEAFFVHGRPLVDPKRPRLYLSRRFDFCLLVGLGISIFVLIAHILMVIFTMPQKPRATNYVTSQCANMEGEWNKEHTVLRFWYVPYAVPPIIRKEASFPEIFYDIWEKFGLSVGGFRWYKTITVPNTEYCFLSFDKRCTFKSSQWTCVMNRINKSSTCLELDNSGNIVSGSTEDCLTLDISMPVFKGELFPVIVVFTGFRSIRNPLNPQTHNEPAYIPTDEAVTGFAALWVNVRYRLGPFGSFYDFNTLGAEDQSSRYVNFGLRDQQAALLWIQHNIGRFGGDASNVVVLAHDTGATGILQLINMQAHSNVSETWFRAAWLSSGAVNWYHPAYEKWQQLRPYQLLQSLYPCDYGKQPMALSNDKPCAAQARQLLMNMDKASLAERLTDLYSTNTWGANIWDMSRLEEIKVSNWFAVDAEFDKGTPLMWDDVTVKKMFYGVSNRSPPKLGTLVFSSMQSEHDGYPGTTDKDGMELRYLLEQIVFPEQEELFELLAHFEQERSRRPDAWPRQLTQQEYTFDALSALRYACAQGWLLARWLANQTKQYDTRTRFYHVYHRQAPPVPVISVPGLEVSARLAFHGLDMLVLTGNYRGQSGAFASYRSHLWNMFHQFVHGQSIDQRCEVFGNREAKTLTPVMGCELSSAGPQKPVPNTTLHAMCTKVDWEKHFNNVAMFE